MMTTSHPPELILRPATTEDAPSIAKIWVQAFSNPSDRLNLLKYGTCSLTALCSFLEPKIKREIEWVSDYRPYIVVEDKSIGQVISYCQWGYPNDEREEEEERRLFEEKEIYVVKDGGDVQVPEEKRVGGVYDSGPDEMTWSFFPEYYAKGDQLLKDTVGDKRCFKLCNMATHPEHERRGAASRLVSSIFDEADERQVICYLDTNVGGMGKRMYEKLGFKPICLMDFDLERYGGQGQASLISMIREPKPKQ